jgi:hypothetical protein
VAIKKLQEVEGTTPWQKTTLASLANAFFT